MDVDRTRSSRTRSAKTNSIEEGHRASIAQLCRRANRAQTWGRIVLWPLVTACHFAFRDMIPGLVTLSPITSCFRFAFRSLPRTQ